MSIDEQHIALPKLYGAPAYGRPPRTFDAQPRPLDPDDLPIEAERTSEDLELYLGAPMGGNGHADGAGPTGSSGGDAHPTARPFSLRSVGRILSGRP